MSPAEQPATLRRGETVRASDGRTQLLLGLLVFLAVTLTTVLTVFVAVELPSGRIEQPTRPRPQPPEVAPHAALALDLCQVDRAAVGRALGVPLVTDVLTGRPTVRFQDGLFEALSMNPFDSPTTAHPRLHLRGGAGTRATLLAALRGVTGPSATGPFAGYADVRISPKGEVHLAPDLPADRCALLTRALREVWLGSPANFSAAELGVLATRR